MKLEALANELTQLDEDFDQEAGEEEPDVKVIGALQERRTQLLQEQELSARRLAVLSEQQKGSEREEAEERLTEIGAQAANLGVQADTLMGRLTEAFTVAHEALTALRRLSEQRQHLQNEGEYLALRYDLPRCSLSPFPLPERNFLWTLERAREDLAKPIGADTWQHKVSRLKAERDEAKRTVARKEERQPGIKVIGQGKSWAEALNEREEPKREAMRGHIVRGPTRITDLQRR